MKSTYLLTILLLTGVIYSSGCSSATTTPMPTVNPTVSPASYEVIAEGRLEPIHFTDLPVDTDGSVSELLSREGENVEAGQVILRIKSNEARTLESAQVHAALELASAHQALKDAQSKLDDFDIPSKFSGMTAAQAAAKALDNLNAARAAFEPYKNTDIQGYRVNHTYPWLPRYIYVHTDYYRFGPAHELNKAVDVAWVDYRRVCQWIEME